MAIRHDIFVGNQCGRPMEIDQETFDSLPWESKLDILGKYTAPEFLHAYEVTFGHDKLQHLAYEEDIVEYVLREYYSCDSDTKSIFLDALDGKEVISASVWVPVDKNNLLLKICRAIKIHFHTKSVFWERLMNRHEIKKQ